MINKHFDVMKQKKPQIGASNYIFQLVTAIL